MFRPSDLKKINISRADEISPWRRETVLSGVFGPRRGKRRLIASRLTDGFKGDDGRYLARYHERYQPLVEVGRSLKIRGILRFALMAESEKVNGGEGGIRTHGTVARTTVFETVPFNHSGTSPRHTSNVVSSGAEHRQGFQPSQGAISAFAGFFAMHPQEWQKALTGKGLRVFSGAAGFACVSFFRSATRLPVNAAGRSPVKAATRPAAIVMSAGLDRVASGDTGSPPSWG